MPLVALWTDEVWRSLDRLSAKDFFLELFVNFARLTKNLIVRLTDRGRVDGTVCPHLQTSPGMGRKLVELVERHERTMNETSSEVAGCGFVLLLTVVVGRKVAAVSMGYLYEYMIQNE